jgi:hypothetical protein
MRNIFYFCLDLTDMAPLLEELMRQVNQYKPENPWVSANHATYIQRDIHCNISLYLYTGLCCDLFSKSGALRACSWGELHGYCFLSTQPTGFYLLLRRIAPTLPS